MKETNTIMLAIFVALGVMLVAGLVAIPAIEQAALADKGGMPNSGPKKVRERRTPVQFEDNVMLCLPTFFLYLISLPLTCQFDTWDS